MPSNLFYGEGSAACVNLISMINSDIYPMTAVAGVLTGLVVAASYMVGEAINNPKLVTWSKSELIQLFISAISAIFIIYLVVTVCQTPALDVSTLTAVSSNQVDNAPLPVFATLFDGAQLSILKTANFTHSVLNIERYHLSAFNMLEARGRWECGDHLCIFGSNGVSSSPYAGITTISSSFNFAFNSAILSYISSLNYLFLLLFAYNGLALFMIPIGLLVRSVPYLRGLGTLFLSVALCFFIIYPALITLTGFATNSMLKIPNSLKPYQSESKIIEAGSPGSVFQESFDFGEDDYLSDKIFPDGQYFSEALGLAGSAFIAGVFFPTLALLGTIASIRQIGRLLGEEIDLSRIIQMV